MPWTTIQLEVTTPLFNAGADGDAGLRVSSLRGAMRFWFRAFAGLGIGNNIGDLAKLEKCVFGSTDHASPVKLRLASQPPVTEPSQPSWCRGDDGRRIVYLLGQGLGNLRTIEITKPYIDVGRTARIQLNLGDDEDVAALVLASLWLTCAYGGVGARTRRGFGGLRITGVEGQLPSPWTTDTLRSPGLDFYQGMAFLWPQGPLINCVSTLKRLAENCKVPFTLVPGVQPPPTYPVFSKTYTRAGLSGGEHFNEWYFLLAHAGQQLRHFRASRWVLDARYRPPVKTPEWFDVVHGNDRHFGLGALGLPVNFKDGYVVNAYGCGGTELRRASPLWLRPVGDGNEWRLLSFAFHGEFVPDSVEVQLRQRGRRLRPVTVDRADVVDRTTRWIDNLNKDRDLSQPTP